MPPRLLKRGAKQAARHLIAQGQPAMGDRDEEVVAAIKQRVRRRHDARLADGGGRKPQKPQGVGGGARRLKPQPRSDKACARGMRLEVVENGELSARVRSFAEIALHGEAAQSAGRKRGPGVDLRFEAMAASMCADASAAASGAISISEDERKPRHGVRTAASIRGHVRQAPESTKAFSASCVPDVACT